MYEKRPQYYLAIEAARKENNSATFIEFTLSTILDTISDQEKHQVEHQVELTDVQMNVLKSFHSKTLSRKEIFTIIEMNSDSRSFKRHIEPLIKAGLIEMTVPDKPRSRLQKYQLTKNGKVFIDKNRYL